MTKSSNNISMLIATTIFLFGLMFLLFTVSGCTLALNVNAKEKPIEETSKNPVVITND